jgi:hypothetical protein
MVADHSRLRRNAFVTPFSSSLAVWQEQNLAVGHVTDILLQTIDGVFQTKSGLYFRADLFLDQPALQAIRLAQNAE